MVNEPATASGAMEGGGAYNKHGKLQAGAGTFALPHWEQTVWSVALDRSDQPIIVVDYGSSQGKNSLAPMRIAIEVLRSRVGPDRPIIIYHTDLPANDFNTLIEVLETDPERYFRDDANVFPSAIGRSFYRSVLPPDHVHLGWCSFAAMWLSRVPTMLPNHTYFPWMTGAARAAFERQGAEDWEAFLSLRARELRPGGRLVVTVPGADEAGWCGYHDLMNHADAVLTDMIDDGAITADERPRMVIGAFPRRRRALVAPFVGDGRFCDLSVEHCETSVFPDATWAEYEREGDRQLFVNKQAGFYRATFVPSLVACTR